MRWLWAAALGLTAALSCRAAETQTTPAAQTPSAWDPRLANPKPAPDDLVLPLPCGGAMAFRPIAVPSGAGPLDDRAIALGNPDAELGFNEYQRGAFLAAPFRAADGTRLFYLGKYDVTRDQYAAVMNPTCPQASPRGRVAQANVSWFDAVAFSERLSVWLLANAADKLPKQGATPGFVRLPTEEEWEYAARGGAAVSESDYLAPTWPMPEGPERYAIAGAGVSDGAPQQVGQLLPNPLGLYDILGNVEQWVLEPYRLNRVGRLQGMPGGLVARGASYATPIEALRTSARSEIPPFDPASKTATRLAFVGFRVALGGVGGGDLRDVASLRQAFGALARGSAPAADLHARIEQMKQATPNPELRRSLDALAAQLAADERARADGAQQVMRADLNAATALCYVVWRVQRIIALQQEQANNPQFKDLQNDPAMQRLRAGIAANEAEQQTALDAYGELLRQAVASGAAASAAAEAQVVTQEMSARADRRRRFIDVVSKHLATLDGGRPLTPPVMLQDIVAVP